MTDLPPTPTLSATVMLLRDRRSRLEVFMVERHRRVDFTTNALVFPGGKVDEGEAPHDALARELREELGLEVRVERPITFAVHEEPGLRILLLFYAVQIVDGKPRGREGQAVKWVSVTDLPSYPTPPADAEIVRRLAEEP